MPEGHSVHRIALQFERNFVGEVIRATSPQGRFADGASLLDGLQLLSARAVGKHLFLQFERHRYLHVHLGLYGAWDFAGEISTGAVTMVSPLAVRIGQTGMRAHTAAEQDAAEQNAREQDALEQDALPESSLGSIGAPRRTRLRMAENESIGTLEDFPPEPIGAVRVRLLTERSVADLRGPTACETLSPGEVDAVLARLGPDPLANPGKASEDAFVAAVRKKATPIGLLLMDQSVVSGIGNVYRAELLYRARLNPHTPGRDISVRALRALWRDWAYLLQVGVSTGQMLTRDGLEAEEYEAALRNKADRHYVYKRTGEKDRRGRGTVVVEEMGSRYLYWSPTWQTRPAKPRTLTQATQKTPEAPPETPESPQHTPDTSTETRPDTRPDTRTETGSE